VTYPDFVLDEAFTRDVRRALNAAPPNPEADEMDRRLGALVLRYHPMFQSQAWCDATPPMSWLHFKNYVMPIIAPPKFWLGDIA
jgi:hypothetical protein